MKTILSIITASLLLASVSANASLWERTKAETLQTSVASTKAAAYQLGINKLMQLKAIPQRGLNLTASVHTRGFVESTLKINEGSFITVQERMIENGRLGYVGLVNIVYSYVENDSEN